MHTVSGSGGAMAVTELKVAEAEAIIEKYDGKLLVAVSNSPKSTVIAGDETALIKVLEEIEGMERFCRQVKVDVASHSPQMDPLMGPLAKDVALVSPERSRIPFYSSVFDHKMEGEALDASYWVNNLRGMVRFTDVISQLIDDGFTAFIEMSPHPVLSNAINECADAKETKLAAIASLLRDKPERETLYNNLGMLYEQGFSINWRYFYRADQIPMCHIPGYPMQHDTYELWDHSAAKDQSFGKVKNPVLGWRIELAGIDDTFLWENKLSLENLSYMKDHRVNQTAVIPGVNYLEMIHAALNEAFGKGYHELKALQFKQPVYLDDQSTIDSQLKITRKSTHEASFKYFTKSAGEITWQICSEGDLEICGSRGTTPTDHLYNLRSGRNDHLITKKEFYKITEAIGLSYGPMFQGIDWVKLNESQAIAHVVPNSIVAENEHPYFIHPAVLDTCFQAIFATFHKEQASQGAITTFLTHTKDFKWYYRPDPADDLIVKAVFKTDDEQTAGVTRKKIELSMYDENGNIVAELQELEAVIIDNEALGSEDTPDWLFDLEWQKYELPKEDDTVGTWLIFRDHLGVSKSLTRQFEQSGCCSPVCRQE
jgi:acyl transferase domain-containing protein